MRTRVAILALTSLAFVSLALAAVQWSLQPRDSTLTFTAVQAGAKFESRFDKFTADIRFDPQDLASGRFDVRIDLNSVDTGDSERDDTLKGPDLFNVQKWPTARYVTESFTSKGNGKYVANGKLTLRDVTREVPIEFTFEPRDPQAWLKGTATLRRLDFGVGQGEWRDTQNVGNEVQVRFALLLKK
jgi:polyisoprenoid-binding protein YceI